MRTDNPLKKVLKSFESFGFEIVSYKEHIKLKNAGDGRIAIVPNHKVVKGTTLQRIVREAGVDRKDFFSKM